MQIIYSVGGGFGDSGFGYIAYNITKYLYQKNLLKKLITITSSKIKIEPRLILTPPFLGNVLKRCPHQVVKDNLFDFFASSKIDKCDIFHGWSHQSLFSIKKAKRLGAITYIERASTHIITQQRLVDKEFKKFGIRKISIHPLIVNKCLREFQEADFICVPSRFAYESFLENSIEYGKLAVIPYGVDLERFRPANKIDDMFRVLYVGLIGFRKGVQYLLEAWSKLDLKNAELILAGPVLREFKGYLRKYRKFPNIKYLGFVKYIENLYQQSSVLVLPSIEDGFGLVVLEAMASGLPVIISNNVGAKDCLTDGQDGFVVTAGDTDSLTSRLKYLYDNQDRAQLMGGSARLKAQKYLWEKTVNNLINIYSRNMLEF